MVKLGEPDACIVAGRGDSEERRSWAQEVLAALESLDRRSAAALRLIYLRRATQAQVSVHLGLPESEIKTIVAEGLRQLASLIVAISAATGSPSGHEAHPRPSSAGQSTP